MKKLLTTIIILAGISASAQTTAQKISALQAADKVIQTSIRNLNASITKLLAITQAQSVKIAYQDSVINELKDDITVQDGRFTFVSNKLKTLQEELDAIHTVYFDTAKFIIKVDTVTLKLLK